jgi:hypothetical protein
MGAMNMAAAATGVLMVFGWCKADPMDFRTSYAFVKLMLMAVSAVIYNILTQFLMAQASLWFEGFLAGHSLLLGLTLGAGVTGFGLGKISRQMQSI